MKLLGGVHYDPGASVSASCASLLAMTAIDTTNLRVTFIAPSTGQVLVRLRGVLSGATSSPSVLLGVLDGATVKARSALISGRNNSGSNNQLGVQASFIIGSLTPGQSYTWDAAYGVEFAVASTGIKYGGPNNTTVNDAFGSFAFEVWDAPGLLAFKHHDPATAVNTPAISAALAMTALDTTNLRCSFVAPSSGKVMARLRVPFGNSTSLAGNVLLGILDGATVKSRTRGLGWLDYLDASAVATQILCIEGIMLVAGLTPGTTYNWDAAIGVETAMTGGTVAYGGPNDTTQNNAWGGAAFDIWNVDDLPRAIGQAA